MLKSGFDRYFIIFWAKTMLYMVFFDEKFVKFHNISNLQSHYHSKTQNNLIYHPKTFYFYYG
jgi:hypothetical protein